MGISRDSAFDDSSEKVQVRGVELACKNIPTTTETTITGMPDSQLNIDGSARRVPVRRANCRTFASDIGGYRALESGSMKSSAGRLRRLRVHTSNTRRNRRAETLISIDNVENLAKVLSK